jgi:hypothetical protein
MKIRIHADFNNSTEDDKVRLIVMGSLRDLEQHKNQLCEGLVVILTDQEIEVEARLQFDSVDGMWLGVPDWSTLRHLPLT